ncbi:MAG: hypothetical protein RL701_6571, partial [Pseudomonadota bacterium]
MALLVAKCAECGFDNPRRWIACARCGHLLGPNAGASSLEDRLNTVTRPTPVLTEEPLSLAAPSHAHNTQLATLATTDDADTALHERDPQQDLDAAFDSSVPNEPNDLHELLFDLHELDGDLAETSVAELPRPQPPLFENTDARPVVGREHAISVLRSNLEHAFTRRCVTLTVIQGAAGMGRTRLLELTSELAARQWVNTRVVYAGCRNSDGGPYAPFSRLLLERFGVTPASSPNRVRADMLNSVARALAGVALHEIRAVTHLLGHIAGVPFPASAVLAALADSPDELRSRACAALLQLVEGDARTRPLLLLLDDMQRAESSAFSLLERLLYANKPIAVVVAGTSDMAPAIAQLAQLVPTETITLPALEVDDIRQLVQVLLPALSINAELVET